MKAAAYPEYVCILHGARALGRPVKWTDERSGSFVSDHHGRDHDMTVEVAFDEDGLIQALRLTGYGNLGGYLRGVRPAAADRQRGEEHRQHVPHAAARSRDPMRVHQHHAGVGLSRRRAAGRRLQHGAHDGLCRGRTRHRPLRAAQAQFHRSARAAVQGGLGHDLRLRRFSRPVQGRAGARRRQRLQAAQAREQARRQAARAWASPAMSKPPRR